MIKIGDDVHKVLFPKLSFCKGEVVQITETRLGKFCVLDIHDVSAVSNDTTEENKWNDAITEKSIKKLKEKVIKEAMRLLEEQMNKYFQQLEEET